MLQFYNVTQEDMNETKNKLLSAVKILSALIFCLIISLCIYLASMIIVYGAWHCPSGNCRTSVWVDAAIFLIWFSPLFIFIGGAYVCRNAVYSLTTNKFLRVIILAAFALFPLFLVAGIIVYAVNS